MRTISLKQLLLLVAIACQWFALIGRSWQTGAGSASGHGLRGDLIGLLTISTLLVGIVVGGIYGLPTPGVGARMLGAFLGGLLVPLTVFGFVLTCVASGPWLALGAAAVAVLGTFYLTRHEETS